MKPTHGKPRAPSAEKREARLKAALKLNIARRKASAETAHKEETERQPAAVSDAREHEDKKT